MSSNRVVVRVSEQSMKLIKAHSTQHNKSLGEAADELLAKAADGGTDLPKEAQDIIALVAKEKALSLEDALAVLITMGSSRYKALRKYAKTNGKSSGGTGKRRRRNSGDGDLSVSVE